MGVASSTRAAGCSSVGSGDASAAAGGASIIFENRSLFDASQCVANCIAANCRPSASSPRAWGRTAKSFRRLCADQVRTVLLVLSRRDRLGFLLGTPRLHTGMVRRTWAEWRRRWSARGAVRGLSRPVDGPRRRDEGRCKGRRPVTVAIPTHIRSSRSADRPSDESYLGIYLHGRQIVDTHQSMRYVQRNFYLDAFASTKHTTVTPCCTQPWYGMHSHFTTLVLVSTEQA